ncbi:MAG: GTPase [Fibrobacter sp.]|nr:GTPase [Fibrobacter sp.]
MSSINFATREISCKVVYYGPGLSGKTTNLQVIHQKMPQDKRTDMVSLETEGDRTLFFDFLPLNLGDIKGFKTKFQLYTVPGQVYYNSTRKIVLRGVDGIVFVADSQRSREAENLESLQNLRQNLEDYGVNLDEIPLVLQYNKRDMENVFTLDEMNQMLNPKAIPFFPATAHNGKGVVTTLKAIAMLVIQRFNLKQGFLRKAADSVHNTGVHDVTVGKEGVSVAPAPSVQPAAPVAPAPAEPSPLAGSMPDLGSSLGSSSASSPFRMPNFVSRAAASEPANRGGLFQKSASPFGRPAAPTPRPSPFGKSAFDSDDKGISDDDIELRPYVPKKK